MTGCDGSYALCAWDVLFPGSTLPDLCKSSWFGLRTVTDQLHRSALSSTLRVPSFIICQRSP